MAVNTTIKMIRNLVESRDIEVKARRLDNGHVVVSLKGRTYDVKDFLASRYYARWNSEDKAWEIEMSEYATFYDRYGDWHSTSKKAEELEKALGSCPWYGEDAPQAEEPEAEPEPEAVEEQPASKEQAPAVDVAEDARPAMTGTVRSLVSDYMSLSNWARAYLADRGPEAERDWEYQNALATIERLGAAIKAMM